MRPNPPNCRKFPSSGRAAKFMCRDAIKEIDGDRDRLERKAARRPNFLPVRNLQGFASLQFRQGALRTGHIVYRAKHPSPSEHNKMPNFPKIGRLWTIGAAGCLLITAASAQDAYDIMSGRIVQTTSSSTMLSYGENPAIEFPPRSPAAARPRIHVEASVSYCVRTCDGRYFPAPSGDSQSKAQNCKNLCPASETKVFSGSSIDSATAKDGRAYSALPNAFLYRKELVAGCTCNGKDTVGLASIKPDQDTTLRRGDLIARETGLELVRRADAGHVSFAKAPVATRSKYERLPVLASD